MVGCRCRSYADTEVDLPVWRYVQIHCREELLLLIVKGLKAVQRSIVGVVFKIAGDVLVEVIADLGIGRKPYTLIDSLSVKRSFERGVHGEIPAAYRLVHNGADLPCPGISRELASLVPNLGGEAYTYWPVPAVGNTNARTDMVANPLPSISIASAGENVEANFRPIVDTLGNFDRFVLRMIGGIESVRGVLRTGERFAAVDGEIARACFINRFGLKLETFGRGGLVDFLLA